jgi:hypothetical protein
MPVNQRPDSQSRRHRPILQRAPPPGRRPEPRHVAREEAVPLVDVHREFEDYGNGPGQSVRDLLIEGDGIHPNTFGQRLVCRVLAAEIAGLVRP